MFVRVKTTGAYEYLQIVESRREDGKVRQQVIASLGRLDKLTATGRLDDLVCALARFCKRVRIIDAQREGSISSRAVRKIGPALVFEKLWRQTAIADVLKELLVGRRFRFDVERALFLTVLHRLFDSGSDRQAERWREDFLVEGGERLQLHHLYRAMAWLGEKLPRCEQDAATPFSPRCTKDLVEEALFSRRRDLFSTLDLVFFDTTSIYFEGAGGQTLGRRGNSKDSRPDLMQMVVGAALDGEGRPICCEMWPGNTADVKTLVPVVERLRARFGIGGLCVVADRGMISADTVEKLESCDNIEYILGARMRRCKEVRDEVLSRKGAWEEVYPKSPLPKDPSPLKVKEVIVEKADETRRYIVCYNEDQAKKDAADRALIVSALTEKLKAGDKGLVGNKGYRKYLKSRGARFEIDEDKIRSEARYDGIWVLRTNTSLSARDVALKYKQLWMVEQVFRTTKSILMTRPIFHKCDETILGHVFCSFLALIVKAELFERLEGRGHLYEWNDIRRDLEALSETELVIDDETYFVRTPLRGTATEVLRAAGVALPPWLRR